MDILPQLLVNALITGSIYALASAGLSLTYGLLRVLNFAHGHIMMAGAYAFYYASVDQGLGVAFSGIFAAFATTIVAFGSLTVFVLPFTAYSFFLPFVTTLSLATVLESAVAMIFDVNVKSLTAGISITSYEIHGVYITPIQIVIIASALSILALLALVVHSTPLGRQIRALREHTEAGQSLGINARRVSYGVFTAGMLLAAYAGVLIGYETNLQPTMGNTYTIKAFAAMILGGLGNIWGTTIGAYILGLVENLSIGLDLGDYSLPAGYKDAFAFVIILIVLLVKPEGLFGAKRRVS